jgi:hypothetical protein
VTWKLCTGCGEELPSTTEFFWRDRYERDGLRKRCKACCQETPYMIMRRGHDSTLPLYLYRWNRMDRKGQLCRVLVRGGRNSCLVEFVADGFRAVTSRNALRKWRAA